MRAKPLTITLTLIDTIVPKSVLPAQTPNARSHPICKQTTIAYWVPVGMRAFRALVKQGKWTLLESALRNVLYLTVTSSMVTLSLEYATAWGVFNTIRFVCGRMSKRVSGCECVSVCVCV